MGGMKELLDHKLRTPKSKSTGTPKARPGPLPTPTAQPSPPPGGYVNREALAWKLAWAVGTTYGIKYSKRTPVFGWAYRLATKLEDDSMTGML